MQRYFARVENGVVRETISLAYGLTPGNLFPPELAAQFVECGEEVVGWWTWDGAVFSPPAPITPPASIPAAVSPRQIRVALLAIDMLDEIEAYVSQAPQAVRIAWDYAIEIKRDNAMIAAAAQALGKTSDDVDALFVAAAAL